MTKSGTSQFHGGVYEFFRNDALAANNWSNNANKVNMIDSANPLNNCSTNFTSTCKAKAPPLRWNDFGGTIGGPIYIPGKYNKDKNKTFFFYSQEHRRIITYTTFNPTLPTTAMLPGHFQPAGLHHGHHRHLPGRVAPVTQIPTNLINPNSAAYIKDIFSKLPLAAHQHRGRHHVPASSRSATSTTPIRTSRASIIPSTRSSSSGASLKSTRSPPPNPAASSRGRRFPAARSPTPIPRDAPSWSTLSTPSGPRLLNDAGFNFSQSAHLTRLRSG